MLDQVEEAGLDVVTLDEAARRLREDDERRFVCFTFDQAYRDTLRHAYPLFQQRSLPLTRLYRHRLCVRLGRALVARARGGRRAGKRDRALPPRRLVASPDGNGGGEAAGFEQIYEWLRSVDEARQRQVIRALADTYDIDMSAACHELMLGWDEIAALAADPLVAIGAQSKAHYADLQARPEKALSEMEGSADIIEDKLRAQPVHFSFPYGDETAARARDFALAKEAGFKTAVTTRRGMLFPAHRRFLTALPRVPARRRLSVADLSALYLSARPSPSAIASSGSAPPERSRLKDGASSGSEAGGHHPGKPGDEEEGKLGEGVAVVNTPGARLATTSA